VPTILFHLTGSSWEEWKISGYFKDKRSSDGRAHYHHWEHGGVMQNDLKLPVLDDILSFPAWVDAAAAAAGVTFDKENAYVSCTNKKAVPALRAWLMGREIPRAEKPAPRRRR
jgi:hypothetical protein